jgi:uncharacterized protein YccT (UPF0319 family)
MKMPKKPQSVTDEQIKQGIIQSTKGNPAQKAKIMEQVAKEGSLQLWYKKAYAENYEAAKKVLNA